MDLDVAGAGAGLAVDVSATGVGLAGLAVDLVGTGSVAGLVGGCTSICLGGCTATVVGVSSCCQIFWDGGGMAIPRNGPHPGNGCHCGILKQTQSKSSILGYQHGKAVCVCAEMLHGKALVSTVCWKCCKHKIIIWQHFSMPSKCKSKLHILEMYIHGISRGFGLLGFILAGYLSF